MVGGPREPRRQTNKEATLGGQVEFADGLLGAVVVWELTDRLGAERTWGGVLQENLVIHIESFGCSWHKLESGEIGGFLRGLQWHGTV